MFIPHSRTIVLLFAILLSGPLVPATGTAFAETMMPLSGKQEPLRLAIARITHGHSAWIFGNKATDAVRVVGIYEPDKALASRFRERYDLPTELFYDNLEDMLKATRPEAVAAFGSIYRSEEHTSELQSLMRISYAVFCLKKKKKK